MPQKYFHESFPSYIELNIVFNSLVPSNLAIDRFLTGLTTLCCPQLPHILLNPMANVTCLLVLDTLVAISAYRLQPHR